MRQIFLTLISLLIVQVCANTNEIGWFRLEENKMNKNIRYIFSDGGTGKQKLKDAHIKFDLTFVPENYEKLIKNNQLIRAYIIVIDSKDVEEMEMIIQSN